MALNQTTRDHYALAAAACFHLNGFPNRLKGLGLGSLKKAAGIDHNRIGLGRIRCNREPVLGEKAEHPLAIHKILGATEAHERN